MEAQYKIIEADEDDSIDSYPSMDLIRIKGERNLIASWNLFPIGMSSATFNSNVAEMQRQYSHPDNRRPISLSEPTTAESLTVASYALADKYKSRILNFRWLQLGRIVRTSEGVFANIPKHIDGTLITDEKTLMSFLTPDKKDKGIYLFGNDFGFAPYETFKQGEQDTGDFAESGLARVLEASQNPKAFRRISSKKDVFVADLSSVSRPIAEIAGIFSNAPVLIVGSHPYSGFGCAFGVLK